MTSISEQLYQIGIVPVIKLDDPADAVSLGHALCDGGIPCAEITFRTDAAEESIRRIAAELPDMLVGAGTVLTVDQAKRAVDAGAKFIVSPGLNPKTVAFCLEQEIPIFPGCANPSDLELAIELGLHTVKIFPAEQVGGIRMIKALSGPFPQLRFMPTGGVNAQNLGEYLAFPKVIACGGSWMVPADALAAKDFSKITTLASEAMRNMLGFELAHIGINADTAENAASVAGTICHAFGFPYLDGETAIFTGTAAEVIKHPYRGTHGHIAIRVNSCDRAVAYLSRKGIAFDFDSATYTDDGRMKLIYFRDEIGGFAFHLTQKQ
jgi:2-dehydro-3-deoxyphosphogluconate aldolase/(4S)-4-hydroxy-2-oxoglutarate aldolase